MVFVLLLLCGRDGFPTGVTVSPGGGGKCLHWALPGAGDELPPQRGEVALLAGRREGFSLGAISRSLSLQLGDLEPDRSRKHPSPVKSS